MKKRIRAGIFLGAALAVTGPGGVYAGARDHGPGHEKKSDAQVADFPDDPAVLTRELPVHPSPKYPYGAYLTGESGGGIFQVDFGADGKVIKVEVLQSTGSWELDHTCQATLNLWRARRPRGWEKVRVPITFRYGSKNVRWGI